MFVYEARFGVKGNNAHAPNARARVSIYPRGIKDCALKGSSRVSLSVRGEEITRSACPDFTPAERVKRIHRILSIFRRNRRKEFEKLGERRKEKIVESLRAPIYGIPKKKNFCPRPPARWAGKARKGGRGAGRG